MRKLKRSTAPTADIANATTHQPPQRTCTICLRQHPTPDVLALRRCTHMFCRSCLTRYFTLVVHKEMQFPVKCCKMPIPLADAEKYLPVKLAKQYRAKTAEYAEEDRTYCFVQTCSRFIPAYSVFDKRAVCLKCLGTTCAKCKEEWHEGACLVVEDPLLMQLARRMDWVQCPHCKSLVERDGGCNHMV